MEVKDRKPEFKPIRQFSVRLLDASADILKDAIENMRQAINGGTPDVEYSFHPRNMRAKHRAIRRKTRRCHEVGLECVQEEVIKPIVHTPEGTVDFYGPLAAGNANGQHVSRLAIGWWTDKTNEKHIHLFGDRILVVTNQLVAVPRLFPFGCNPYYVVYPADNYDCIGCKCHLPIGEGVWRPNHFICDSCLYQEETGLRPGYNKIFKRRKHK